MCPSANGLMRPIGPRYRAFRLMPGEFAREVALAGLEGFARIGECK
jgi:hypothetical protein